MTGKTAAINRAAKKIKLLILDVDGVLTDGSIILDSNNNEIKAFHVRDGHGIKLLQKNGISVAIITGRKSKVVERRARELGIQEVFQNCRDKGIVYRRLKEKLSIHDAEVAYVGDDIVDIPVMRLVGLPVAVADASSDIMPFASFVTRSRGGRGAVREVAELILKAKGLWRRLLDEYASA